MGEEAVSESERALKWLRALTFIPLAWLVFLVVVPDFLMALYGRDVFWFHATADIVAAILTGAVTFLLLRQIRQQRDVVRLVLVGLVLYAASHAFKNIRAFHLLDNVPIENWERVLNLLDDAFNALGLILIAAAFFLCIIDLLRANRRAAAEHASLAQEMEARKRAQTTLHESEATLRAISTSAHDAIIMMNDAGLVCYWNPAAERILGYSTEEIFGKPLHDVLAPNHYRGAYLLGMSAWRQSGRGRVVNNTLELKGRRKDETEIDVELSVSSVLIGDQWYAVGILRNITARKQAQRQHETILRTTTAGFVIMDAQGRFLEVNDAYCRVLGYSREELLGMRLQNVETIEGPQEIAQHIRRVQHAGADRFETRHRRKDGSLVDIEVSVNYSELAGGELFAFFRDITDRKRSEQALRTSEAKYRELVENANSIILRMDTEGRITFFNEFAQQFFGFSEPEILGRSAVGTVVPETDTSGRDLADMIQNIVHRPEDYMNNENENMRRNGERVWIAWTNKAIYDDAGQIKGVLCIGNDVTERVRAERVIYDQRMKMVRTARLSSLGMMAGSIAHEINNPLAVISAAAEQLDSLINSERPNPEPVHRVADAIMRNVGRIHRIVRGLRAMSRDGSTEPFTKISVNRLILEILELGQARFAAHEILLRVANIPDGLEIECRPTEIGQVLVNLLNNAYDAVEGLNDRWIFLDVRDEGDAVALSVTDSGPGLPEEVQQRIFAPFFTTKGVDQGVGLGLSISHHIVETHHGALEIDTACPNTRFVVRLPKQQPAEIAEPVRPSQEAPA